MKKTGFLFLFAAIFVVVTTATAFAQNPNFNASRTFEFDPDKTGGSVAYWKNGIGQTDSTCKTNFGLNLEKNAALSDNVSSGAVLNGLKGVTVIAGDTLGYDIKAGSPCGAGAPRFNVSYLLPDGVTTGFSFVGGCANGTSAPAPTPGWARVTMGLQNPAQAFPVIPPGSTLQSVVLIVDEPGKYVLDNIQYKLYYADKPGNSGLAPSCP